MRAIWIGLCCLCTALPSAAQPKTLPGTKPLRMEGDPAAKMVAGIDRYLAKATKRAAAQRLTQWRWDFSSTEAYTKALADKRERLRKIVGVVDRRLPPQLEYVGGPGRPSRLAEVAGVTIHAIRWQVLEGMDGEGLLLQPKGKPRACVILLPDCDEEPETYAGLIAASGRSPVALSLARAGCLVFIPVLIDRRDEWSGNPEVRMTNQPHREFVYRMAYEMGRHVIGYEVQKVLAAVDWCESRFPDVKVAVVGYGEGGLIAFYAAAVDTRIDVAAVSGYFGRRDELWREPIYRNIWTLLRDFGEEGVAALIAPRVLLVEDHPGPLIKGPPPERKGRFGAAPGGTEHFLEQKDRAVGVVAWLRKNVYGRLRLPAGIDGSLQYIDARDGDPWSARFVGALAARLGLDKPPKDSLPGQNVVAAEDRRIARRKRQFQEVVDYTQRLLPTAVLRRDRFWSRLDTSTLENFSRSAAMYRSYFHENIIGKLPPADRPINPRSRLIYQTAKWKGYEIVLDLYEDVFCYGILLVPNDLRPGERRPVVVCQHGLEGRPTDVCNPNKKTRAYNSFGARLADRGYIVFAPQNPYIGRDRFRVLIRKGHPLGISLYSFIVRQHERILEWLATLPFVDSRRIAFYGLSYGGKVAMRIPALVSGYAVVICSGDFNEWIWKNINLIWRGSYMFTIEYDMYEFDLGNTFNYAEMARLIAPRPFMVERGHNDGVGLDEWVAHEYARVRRFYARLGIPDRTEIEFFSGGHEIHGVGTFRFLDRHLKGKQASE